MQTIKLKKGHDQRARSQHPWIFSNELMDSPKGIRVGEIIEIQDHKGHFIGYGYGNPHSLIALRVLGYNSATDVRNLTQLLTHRIFKAWLTRIELGFEYSYRVVFSEADSLPGFILDRYTSYRTENGKKIPIQILSYQVLTLGMEHLLKSLNEILESAVQMLNEQNLMSISWKDTIVLQKNDVNIRKLEGLTYDEPRVTYDVLNHSCQSDQLNVDLANLQIQMKAQGPSQNKRVNQTKNQSIKESNSQDFESDCVEFNVNLIEGQKTGFFLDQSFNIHLVIKALQSLIKIQNYTKENPFRLIDLCCYMGQWSVQLSQFLKSQNIPFEVTLVDVSELALQKAKKNVEQYTQNVKVIKGDVLKDLAGLTQSYYDVVISDPPAFVKNKKDLESGLHGYMKLNEQAFRIAKHKGFVASCTCSGLVEESDFKASLRKAILRSGKIAQLIASGGLGWDHPTLLQFPEGQYLQMLLHKVQ